MNAVELAYEAAKERYAQIGVDTQKALEILGRTRISFNAWQFDDVKGFLKKDSAMSGGILSTGGYPGAAANPDQLRQDADMAFSLLPGKHKLSLQATQVDTSEQIDLDEIEPKSVSYTHLCETADDGEGPEGICAGGFHQVREKGSGVSFRFFEGGLYRHRSGAFAG